jgi:hypothetical protein
VTQYLLSIHHDYSRPVHESDEEREAMFVTVGAFNKKVIDAGEFVFAGGLQPPHTATVQDGTTGEVHTTSGPYLNSREHLSGFWVLELPDVETAVSRAADASVACGEAVEVRPFNSL